MKESLNNEAMVVLAISQNRTKEIGISSINLKSTEITLQQVCVDYSFI